MEEKVIDLRIPDKERDDDGQRTACLVFKLNHTMPGTEEYNAVLHDLFQDNIGEGSMVTAPLTLVLARPVKIGKGVMV